MEENMLAYAADEKMRPFLPLEGPLPWRAWQAGRVDVPSRLFDTLRVHHVTRCEMLTAEMLQMEKNKHRRNLAHDKFSMKKRQSGH